jgi:hypothetical protein
MRTEHWNSRGMFDCAKCDIDLVVCGIQNVDQVLDQHFTNPEEDQRKRKLRNMKRQLRKERNARLVFN